MPIAPEIIDKAKAQLKAQLKAKYPQLSEEQLAEAYAACLMHDRVASSLQYAGDVWEQTPVRVDQLIELALEAKPELTKPDPGAAAVAEHLLQEAVRVYGAERIGELRIDAYRRAEAMTPQERIQTGVKAPPEGQPVSEGSATKAVPLWERPYDWAGWHNELAVRVPVHPASLLPSERKRWIDEIKKDARNAAKLPHHADVDAVSRIKAKPEDQRSAEERMTLHRLGG